MRQSDPLDWTTITVALIVLLGFVAYLVLNWQPEVCW